MLATSSQAQSQNKEKSPTQIVTEFYQWSVVHDDGGGLPEEKNLKHLQSFLSSDLMYLIHASIAAQERCIAITLAGDKPNVFEGSLFAGSYENFTKVISITEKKTEKKTAKASIIYAKLMYENPRNSAEKVTWTDKVTLIRENEKWLINNFENKQAKSNLKLILKKYISKEECGI